MLYSSLSDRVITCPECQADNTLIGSDLTPNMAIHCSQCRAIIGRWSDTRDRHVTIEAIITSALSDSSDDYSSNTER